WATLFRQLPIAARFHAVHLSMEIGTLCRHHAARMGSAAGQSVNDHGEERRHCGCFSRRNTVGSPPLAKRTPASAQAAILSTTARGSPAATAIVIAAFAAIAQAPAGGVTGF